MYMYLNEDGWKHKGSTTVSSLAFELPLTKYAEKYGQGFTYEDVIISHLNLAKSSKVNSEYFLFTTLSINSGVKRIFELYDAGEFK